MHQVWKRLTDEETVQFFTKKEFQEGVTEALSSLKRPADLLSPLFGVTSVIALHPHMFRGRSIGS